MKPEGCTRTRGSSVLDSRVGQFFANVQSVLAGSSRRPRRSFLLASGYRDDRDLVFPKTAGSSLGDVLREAASVGGREIDAVEDAHLVFVGGFSERQRVPGVVLERAAPGDARSGSDLHRRVEVR